MAVAALKIKLMPEGLDTNLDAIKEKAKDKASKLGAMNISFVEENIAFGLKAVIVTLAWPEEKDTSLIESELGAIEGVSSSQIIDYRRAFG